MDGRNLMGEARKQHKLKHDLDGKIFNYLEVIGPLNEKNSNKAYLYECRCLVCGKLTKATRSALKGGMKKTCGKPKCWNTVRSYMAKKTMKYPPWNDCNGYKTECFCTIVDEMMCRTRGYCKFYKKNEVAKQIELLETV